MSAINRILRSSHFIRSLKKLPLELQIEAVQREKMFGADCFDPKLKTHKLSGKLKNQWSFSVNYQYRILFEFLPDDQALFIDIGDHDIYK